MISPELSTGITLTLYCLASTAGIGGVLARRPFWRRLGCVLACTGFASQTFMLLMGFHRTLPDGLSLGAYLQMLAWFVVLCGMGVLAKFRQESALIFAAPLGLMLFAVSAPYLGAVVQAPPSLTASFYALHIGALFLSLGLLALSCAAGALFLLTDLRIKRKQYIKGFWQDMPGLSVLDRINSMTTAAAFPLYTLGLVSGLVWAKPVFGTTMSGDPKEVFSILVWLLLAALFSNRLTRGWKGRKPAQLAVLIFLLCLFSITVVNTVMETHHAFTKR